MNNFLKRIFALLLCAALLASLSVAFAVKATDFHTILEAGSNSISSIYPVTDPQFYTAGVSAFCNDYAVYRDPLTGYPGIMDYHGTIVAAPTEQAPYPIKALSNNLYLGIDRYIEEYIRFGYLPEYVSGYFYDFQGNRIPELEELQITPNHCGSCQDSATGERYAWIQSYEPEAEQGDTLTMYKRLIKSDGSIFFPGWNLVVSAPVNGICLTYNTTDDRYGLMELSGAERMPTKCSYLRFLTPDLLVCCQNGAWTLRRPDGSVVKELPYDTILRNDDGLIVGKDGRYGVLDFDGEVVIPLEYDSIRHCTDDVFHFLGSLGQTNYMISEDPVLTYCGTRNFPYQTIVLAQDRYVICEGDIYSGNWYLVDGQGQHLIPDSLCGQGGYRRGSKLYLLLQVPEVIRIYDLDLNLLEEKHGTIEPCETSSAWTCTDETGKNYVEFFNEAGEVLKTIDGVCVCCSNRFGLGLRREDEMCAFCSPQGELLTDYEFTNITDMSGGKETPYFIGVHADDDGYKSYVIDARTGKNAILENARVKSTVDLIYPGTYFPFYVDGKMGVARLTARDESPFRDVGNSTWFTEAVKFCYNAGLISGMGGGDFGPQVTMNRAMLVTVLYRISGEKTASHGFADVPEGKYYTDAVNWAASLGIVKGKTETTFCPKDPVTREQLVAILYNYACLFGEQEADPSVLDSFEDAGRVGNYAKTPMAWAVGVGLVKGRTSTTLDPKGNATRAEIAVILMRFIRYMAA